MLRADYCPACGRVTRPEGREGGYIKFVCGFCCKRWVIFEEN